MRVASNKLWLLVLAVAVVPSVASGQRGTRSRVRWEAPRLQGISVIGGRLTTNTYGLGTLSTASGQAGAGLLRRNLASLASSPNFNVRSTSGGVPLPSRGSYAYGTAAGQRYGTAGVPLKALTEVIGPLVGDSAQLGETLSGGLDAYLLAMGRGSELRVEEDKPITSFVPDATSIYRDHMKKGDEHFRKGEYFDANGVFEIALTFSRRVPEVHLSLAHVRFALGSYYGASFHLQQALTYFPELALVRMKIRDFYAEGKPKEFDEHCAKLKERLDDPAAGGDLWLLMAYVLYFDGKANEAAEALRRADQLSRRSEENQAIAQAAQTFWDGMAAAGKVKGRLHPGAEPTTLPGKVPGPSPAPAPPEPQAEDSGPAAGATRPAAP